LRTLSSKEFWDDFVKKEREVEAFGSPSSLFLLEHVEELIRDGSNDREGCFEPFPPKAGAFGGDQRRVRFDSMEYSETQGKEAYQSGFPVLRSTSDVPIRQWTDVWRTRAVGFG
jgi:hypothetical protein